MGSTVHESDYCGGIHLKISNKRFREEYWHEFFYRGDRDPFPLSVMPPNARPLVTKFDALVSLLEYYRDRNVDCYYSLFSLVQRWLGEFDIIWFDVDYNEHVKQKTQIAAKKIDSHLEDRGIPYRRLITANRGLHYYIKIEPVQLANPWYTIKQWMLRLPDIPKTLKTKTLKDGTVVQRVASAYDKSSQNMKQMARVPLTVHPKTGLEMVECYGNIEFMPEIEVRPWERCKKVSIELMELDSEAPEVKEHDKNVRAVIDFWPHCIFEAIEMLSSEDPRNKGESMISHDQSRHLTSFLYRVGWPPEKIISLFRTLRPDFNERTCTYQVYNIVNSKILPNNCENTRLIGLCPESEHRFRTCPFYPNIMIGLTAISEENEQRERLGLPVESLKWDV